MAETVVDPKQLAAAVKIVKRLEGERIDVAKVISDELDVKIPTAMLLYFNAELEIDPKLRIPATPASVKKAREGGIRWPRIAVRTGLSEAKVKALYTEAGGNVADSYTGLGRPPAGSSGKKSAASTSTKKSTGKKDKGGKAAPARTRAERLAAAGKNP